MKQAWGSRCAVTVLACITAQFLFQPSCASATTLIHAGELLAVPGESPRRDQTIVIEDGRVVEVRDGLLEPDDYGDGAFLIDLSGAFVMPGLIDCHVHITGQYGPRLKLDMVEMSHELQTLRALSYARVTLDAGFTTIRDPGADPGPVFALRDAIDKGYVIGPRILASGMAVTPTGGHGDVSGFRPDIMALMARNTVCDGPDDCRRAVRQAVKAGADFIKITATGGVLSETATGTGQQLTDDELEEIVATAHALGRKVAAHAHDAEGINAALRAGVDSIEHGSYADEESVRLFRETGAYLVPTLMVGESVLAMAASGQLPDMVRAKAEAVGPAMLRHTAAAYKAGVKIAFGTDSGVSPHGQNAREFLLLRQAGLTPMEAIETATVNAAELLGLGEQIGSLEPGKSADIVATSGSPLDDLSELLDVDFVMKGGVVVRRPAESTIPLTTTGNAL